MIGFHPVMRRSGVTHSVIMPCQFGGNPDCSNCGCLASAGLEAIGRHRLKGVIRVGSIFDASLRVGQAVDKLRRAGSSAAGI